MHRDALEDRTNAYLVEQGTPSGECSTPLQQSIDVEDYTHSSNNMDDGGESRVDHQYWRKTVMIGGGKRDDGVSASHSEDMYQTMSDTRSEVAHVHKYSINGMTLRPTTPTFLDALQIGET
jgi:hypothetical protein